MFRRPYLESSQACGRHGIWTELVLGINRLDTARRDSKGGMPGKMHTKVVHANVE